MATDLGTACRYSTPAVPLEEDEGEEDFTPVGEEVEVEEGDEVVVMRIFVGAPVQPLMAASSLSSSVAVQRWLCCMRRSRTDRRVAGATSPQAEDTMSPLLDAVLLLEGLLTCCTVIPPPPS